MQLREATDEDHALIARMRIAFLAERDSWPSEPPLEELTADILELLATTENWSWLAEVDGTCVGVVTVIVQPVPPRAGERRMREGYLVNVYVDPEHRRVGLARALMDAVIAAAEDRGLRQLVLHATDDGRPLYHQLGFRDPGTWMERRFPAG